MLHNKISEIMLIEDFSSHLYLYIFFERVVNGFEDIQHRRDELKYIITIVKFIH